MSLTRKALSHAAGSFFRKRLQSIVESYTFSVTTATSQSSRPPIDRDSALARCDAYVAHLVKVPVPTAGPSDEDTRDRVDSVFANNFIDLEQVKAIGFDLDYTLVSYTTELQSFLYERAKQRLLDQFAYPSSLQECCFDEHFAIRGLSVDPAHGLLLKLSNSQRVGSSSAYRGKRPVSSLELQALYGTSRHIPISDLEGLRPLHDKYALAKACLIADAIDHFETRKQKFGEEYRPSCVVDDVYRAVEAVHVSGELHGAIQQDLDRFVQPSPRLQTLLAGLAGGGKRFFLCTNSGFDYSNRTLSHVLGLPHCPSGSGWRDLFDVVVCSAQKPSFYFDGRPFREWDPASHSASARPVSSLDRGKVFVHGSAQVLMEATGWRGKDILYLGDNLQADLQEARRWHGWHTGCIINEVESEVHAQDTPRFRELHLLRSLTRSLLIDVQKAFHRKSPPGAAHPGRAQEEQLVRELQTELQAINAEMSSCFNLQFGGIFRTDTHPSLFSVAVRKYADIYMKDVECLVNYSPNHKFYPTQSIHMAHDNTFSVPN